MKKSMFDYFLITVTNGRKVRVENHDGIKNMQNNKITVAKGSRLIAISGENLTVTELDGINMTVIGKILSIEYLT